MKRNPNPTLHFKKPYYTPLYRMFFSLHDPYLRPLFFFGNFFFQSLFFFPKKNTQMKTPLQTLNTLKNTPYRPPTHEKNPLQTPLFSKIVFFQGGTLKIFFMKTPITTLHSKKNTSTRPPQTLFLGLFPLEAIKIL